MNTAHLLALGCLIAVASASCPNKCRCLPDPHRPTDLKISCQWSTIPGDYYPFSSFPASQTRSLRITCQDADNSQLSAGLFEQFTRLRNLELRGCSPKNGYISAEVFRGLSELRTLHLDNVGATKLRLDSDAAKHLRRVERLSLTDSGVVHLPRGIFCTLNELKMLNFSGNQFTSLEGIGLSNDNCSNQLVLLDMSRNRLTKLMPNDFSPLRALRVLDLSQNKLQSIAEDAFALAPDLQELFLENNRLVELDHLPAALRFLDLSRNHLPIIPKSLSLLMSLARLNLSQNRLDSSTPFLLQSRKLEVLDLSQNSFRTVPKRLFQNLTAITFLSMQQNRIESLETGVFESLSNLIDLDLSRNRLTGLSRAQMSGLSALAMLRLDHNMLTNFSLDALDATPKLSSLFISDNLLLQVPTSLTRLYHLQELDLSHNKISTILKFLFNKLPNLNRLDLSGNKLSRVERYVFEDMQSLTDLRLSANNIDTLESYCFELCPNLRSVHLDRNVIAEVGTVFSNLNRLQSLNLTINQLIEMDLAMLPVSLVLLELSNNRVTKLENTRADRAMALELMDLSFNKLSSLHAALVPDNVRNANFSYNRLHTISADTFYHKKRLGALDLRHNQLQQINLSSVEVSHDSDIRQLYVSGNPLQCTCELDWLKKLQTNMANSRLKVPDLGAVECRHVLTGRVAPITQVERGQFLCRYEQICAGDCLCCDFDSCDCNNVCPPGCVCYRDSTLSSNIAQCSNLKHPISIRQIPMYATEIRLDGTNLTELNRHTFLGRFRLRHLYLNNTSLKSVESQAFNGLTNLELLDLSDNQLTEVRGDEFRNTPKLAHLFLNGNKLSVVQNGAFDALPSLQSLTLHANQLTLLPLAVVQASSTLYRLSLSDNPWRCDCDNRFLLQQWLPNPTNVALVHDLGSVACVENVTAAYLSNDTTILSEKLPPNDGDLVKVNFWTFRTELNQSLCRPLEPLSSTQAPNPQLEEEEKAVNKLFIFVAIALVFALLLCCVVVALLVNCRQRLSKKRYKSPPSVNSSQTTSTPIPLIGYDIFLSYSLEDEPLAQPLAARLEQEAPYYQLCMLHKDLAVNTNQTVHRVQDEIIRAMERSQCIVLMLSKSFLEQEWNMLEIRMAHQCFSRDKSRIRIVVQMDDTNLDSLDQELGRYLRNSYLLQLNDPLFWSRMRELLPSRSHAEDTFASGSTHYSDLYGSIDTRNFVKTGYV